MGGRFLTAVLAFWLSLPCCIQGAELVNVGTAEDLQEALAGNATHIRVVSHIDASGVLNHGQTEPWGNFTFAFPVPPQTRSITGSCTDRPATTLGGVWKPGMCVLEVPFASGFLFEVITDAVWMHSLYIKLTGDDAGSQQAMRTGVYAPYMEDAASFYLTDTSIETPPSGVDQQSSVYVSPIIMTSTYGWTDNVRMVAVGLHTVSDHANRSPQLPPVLVAEVDAKEPIPAANSSASFVNSTFVVRNAQAQGLILAGTDVRVENCTFTSEPEGVADILFEGSMGEQRAYLDGTNYTVAARQGNDTVNVRTVPLSWSNTKARERLDRAPFLSLQDTKFQALQDEVNSLAPASAPLPAAAWPPPRPEEAASQTSFAQVDSPSEEQSTPAAVVAMAVIASLSILGAVAAITAYFACRRRYGRRVRQAAAGLVPALTPASKAASPGYSSHSNALSRGLRDAYGPGEKSRREAESVTMAAMTENVDVLSGGLKETDRRTHPAHESAPGTSRHEPGTIASGSGAVLETTDTQSFAPMFATPAGPSGTSLMLRRLSDPPYCGKLVADPSPSPQTSRGLSDSSSPLHPSASWCRSPVFTRIYNGSGSAPECEQAPRLQEALDTLHSNGLTLAGRWTVLAGDRRKVGGQGLVQAAHDELRDEEVMIKFYHDTYTYEQEAGLFGQPRMRGLMPGVVHMEPAGRQCPVVGTLPAWAVLEQGPTLAEWAQARKFKNAREAVQALCKVVEQVNKMHGMGLVHRDIKPSNVVQVRAHRTWTLLDFGCVVDTHVSSNAGLALSLPYTAPEAVAALEAGDACMSVDSSLDMWSVGVLMYEVLSGQRAFASDASPEYIRDCLMGRGPLAWDDLKALDKPTRLQRLVLACLATEPTERPSSEEVLDILIHYIH